MSKRLELRTKMAELQREYSALNDELKALDAADKAESKRQQYKDYLYKIGVYGYALSEESKIEEVSDKDRELSYSSASGLVYTSEDFKDSYAFIMMKSKDEYPRLKLLFTRLQAAERVLSKDEKDKPAYIKVLLGEE